MSNCDKIVGAEQLSVSVVGNSKKFESGDIIGRFECECYDKDGNLKWTDGFDNLITTAGKQMLLNNLRQTFTWSAAHLGLISSDTYSAPVIGDTMTAHSTWKECLANSAVTVPNIAARGVMSFGAPTLNGNNVDMAASAVQFTIQNNGGACQGAFVVINGTSAIGNTTGTLFSAGAFSGGAKTVAVSDTLNVTYTATLVGP